MIIMIVMHMNFLLENIVDESISKQTDVQFRVCILAGWKCWGSTRRREVRPHKGIQILNLCPVLDKEVNIKDGGKAC